MSHKFVILDELMDQLEAAQSGLVPSSIIQSVVSGVQNVPSNIVQSRIGGNSSTAYTTLPLSPISDNCCIDKSYINLQFDCNFNIVAETGSGEAIEETNIPLYIGFRDGAQIFNQIQILIENSAIWQTVYQREEALIAYNALPETEIRGNPQYASIDKLKENLNCPMKKIIVNIPGTSASTSRTIPINIKFKMTVDLNRLTPLLSNLHFTTPHMGNLRLKLFLQQMEKALFICPDYSAVRATAGVQQSWQFYPFGTLFNNGNPVNLISVMNLYTVKGNSLGNLSSLKIQQPTGTTDFISFKSDGLIEIVQTNFKIKDAEYKQLTDYFADMGSVIIPSQTFSTNVFNNSEIISGNYPQSQIGSVGGYNIDFISVWQHPPTCPSIGTKLYGQNIQLILDGRPINPIPYRSIEDKCIVDSTQALIDTDTEEINKDYIRSLNLYNDPSGQSDYLTASKLQTYTGANYNSSTVMTFDNPNSFVLNFATNLPDAFHSGACILENSNRQANIRFLVGSVAGSSDSLYNSTDYPYNLNVMNSDLVSGFTCFCDCCIVLNYDRDRGTCFDGSLSWAAPYV